MTVIAIIGGAFLGFMIVVILIGLIDYADDRAHTLYKHQFFSWSQFVLGGLGWTMFWAGCLWYPSLVQNGGNILNAQALMVFGGIITGGQFVYNANKTSSLFAVLVLPLQAVVYTFGFVVAVYGVLFLLGLLSRD